MYDATQKVVGFTPETNCRCLALEVLSSTKKMTNEAGTKLNANKTVSAYARLTATCSLKWGNYFKD